MPRKTDRRRIIKNAYTVLARKIENEDDLKRYHLTLTDYHIAKEVFNELSRNHTAKTFVSEVAGFYENHGFSVKLSGVNYIISC